MAYNDKSYLGKAMKLPVELVAGAGLTVVGIPCVEQSIQSILSTPIGSRFFLAEYGSRLDDLVFEQNDIVLIDLLRLFIFEALIKWEKRAKFTDIEFSVTEDRVDCIIKYQVLPSSEINSYVYPFYKKLAN